MECIKITLSSDDYSKGEHMNIQNKFFEIFKASGAPQDMMMLTLKDSPIDGKPIFLTPINNDLLQVISRAYQSEISILPSADSLSLRVGHSDAISNLASS